ncbi:hypothetical protein DITRI_Ditri10aG0108800 [Diplodiscus trichospermus]
MTPVYLNPPPSPFPLVKIQEEQHDLQLFLSVPQQAASASSLPAHPYPTFFNTTTDLDQRVVTKSEESKPYHHKVNKFIIHDGSNIDGQASSSSSLQSAVCNHGTANGHDNYESGSDNNGSSVKWMSSKMRLMKKMMNSSCSTTGSADNKVVNKFQYPMLDSDETNSLSKTSNSIRVCSDCNTTTTPLWRSGPRGPKSLCNACGIRQRKARRALEAAAANGAAVVSDATTSTKIKVYNKKEKKSRKSHVAQYRKHHQFKVHSDCNSPHHHKQSQRKLCFKEFALSLSKNSALQRVFPQDVEDAAILLMELSCGLVHS